MKQKTVASILGGAFAVFTVFVSFVSCGALQVNTINSAVSGLAGGSTVIPWVIAILIFVIDVGEGEKIPRKGGPGITKSDLLVINKIDIAEYVHASLEVMDRDTKKQRGDKPYVFTDLYKGIGLDEVIRWIKEDMLFEDMK